jgi:hypothetical protein
MSANIGGSTISHTSAKPAKRGGLICILKLRYLRG